MAEPLSPDHVFDFLEDDPAHDLEDPDMNVEEDPEEDPKEEPKEDPEEDSKEELEEEPEEELKEVTGVSPIIPPPLSESSSDSDYEAPIMSFREDYKALHSRVRYLESGIRTREHENVVTRNGVNQVRRCMDAYDVDLGFIEQDATRTSNGVLALQEENQSLRKRMDSLEVAEAIAEYERNRTNLENAGGAGGAGGSGNAGGEHEIVAGFSRKWNQCFEIISGAEKVDRLTRIGPDNNA
ncbi:hypothetical protein Tco_0671300 [Tanacetum coccineum]